MPGLDRASVIVLGGLDPPIDTACSETDYDRVRQLAAELRRRTPRRVE